MELEYLENEVSIPKGGIENIVSRRSKDEKLSKQSHTDFKNDEDGDVVDKGGNDINESPATQVLCQSLRRMESRKQFHEGIDPDDTDFWTIHDLTITIITIMRIIQSIVIMFMMTVSYIVNTVIPILMHLFLKKKMWG